MRKAPAGTGATKLRYRQFDSSKEKCVMPTAGTLEPLERVLLDNMLATAKPEERNMESEAPKNWFRTWMLALLLILAGIAMIKWLPDNRVVSTAADALLIAGILTLGVDPFLKRDLLTEASRGIFFHILGFEHHPQVKAKLQDIVYGTRLLRTKAHTIVSVAPQADGFLLTIDYETEIVNPTPAKVDYEPRIEWDMAHKPEVLRMSLTSADGKVKWTETNVQLNEFEPGVQQAKPHLVRLLPSTKCAVYRGSGTYRIFTKHGYLITYTGIPTLLTSTRVVIPDGYEVSATKADVYNDHYWEWSSLQMRGDHTTIRWRKIGGEWL
jgi:hypothetical protein